MSDTAILPDSYKLYPYDAPVTITPPIVDDAGLDIYRRLPEKAQQEIRDNITRYLEQVQRDYPPEPRVEGA